MLSIDLYLKDLLFEFDCVIIPGFGGFIMQSNPARIDQVKHRIHPPYRYPSFNSLLIHDDGLLISRIARAGSMSYHDAGQIVHEYAAQLKKKLSRGESIRIIGLGEISGSADGGIFFRPDYSINYHPGVYGMIAVKLSPIVNQPVSGRLISRPVDRPVNDFRKKKPATVKWTLALSLPVIIFLLYGIIFPASIQKIYTNYAGVFIELFHHEGSKPITKQDVIDIKPLKTQEMVPAPEPVVIQQPVIENTPVIEPEITTTTTSVGQSPVKYFIIGGCFEKKENADKFLAQLIEKGYEAEQAGITKKGHARISYRSFSEREPALLYLKKIKEEENPGAWLLKY